jgi:hypothetical protein
MAIITNYLLFNHTYLRQLQADTSVDEQASLAAQGVHEWYAFRDNTSTQTLVDSWVQPLLHILELDLKPLEGGEQGDAAPAMGDNAPQIYLLVTAWDQQTPVGLCYIAPPSANLDTTIKGKHWMAQAVLAARRLAKAGDFEDAQHAPRSPLPAPRSTPPAFRWVILTNGDQWRLLDSQALRRYEAYVQVDLDELVQDPSDLSALRVFYRCFRRSAFGRDEQGASGLERLLAASGRATQQAEDHLKARVSHNEGIMAQLCLGLVEATGKSRFTEAERDAIYQDATYLLYRMLFILYAEARGLLPMDNPAYRAASLGRLVETVYEYELQGMPDPQATTLWEQLKRLCGAIYESDAALGIPAYNGGLFDDADKPHLRAGHIADAYLSQALFDLAYQPAADGYQLIDYRDLSVRHLGSIYEGMIEYKLQIAEETLWARRDGKGNVRFLHTGQDGAPHRNDVEIKPGDVYFSQTPGERRATGTYYTPEYIVDYIVRQTVGQGLAERRAPLEEKVAGWLDEIDAATDPDERARMQRTADEELLRFVEEEVLTFRTCDPAMGSGHFLVNTAHQITNFIVETLHLISWLNGALSADPIAWRRRVAERCLYGVDLSLMAVELAKLSLWLASVAQGRPLSFLDHHLRWGNSLIGAGLEDLAAALAGIASIGPSRKEKKAREAGQLSMLDDPAFQQHVTVATSLLAQISARVAETVEDIKAQEAYYEKVRAELEPYRRLADFWTSRHFGADVDVRQLHAISKYLINGAVSTVPEYQRLLIEVQELADERCFFHWELEFPDVLFDRPSQVSAEKIGFNATIGNPPWGGPRKSDRSFLKKRFSSIVKRLPDLFAYFLARSLDLCKQSNGRYGNIVPHVLLYQGEFSLLRRLLVENGLQQAINLGDNVFEDAVAPSCLVIGQVGKSDPGVAIQNLRSEPRLLGTPASPLPTRLQRDIILKSSDYLIPSYRIEETFLMTRLSENCLPLGEIFDVASAVQTGGDKIFVISRDVAEQNHLEKEYLRPVLFGSDIGRYSTEYKDNVLMYVTRSTQARDIPAIIELLRQSYDRLSAVSEVKAGIRPWFTLHRARDSKIFEQPKIMLRQTGDTLIGTFDRDGFYCIHSIHCVTPLPNNDIDPLFVLSLLNSKLLRALYDSVAQEKGRVFSEVKPRNVKKMPICCINFNIPNEQRKQLEEKARRLYYICRSKGDQGNVIRFVEDQLCQEPERNDVVHDLLAYLAQQMIDLNKERQRLEDEADMFRFVARETPCFQFDKDLGVGELIRQPEDPVAVYHDIEGLRLRQEEDGRWLLEVQAKLRDPSSGWREHQRDADGNLVRRWLPVCRLPLDEANGRFYQYAFAHLDDFKGAGKFPGGSTRTLLEKLHATQVPKFVPVDLAPLVALEAELAEVRRKIEFTGELIDQIVYRLYGLTEEEIAIVEGRA